MTTFGGFDHVDLRVPALPAVEKFYDVFFRELGLTRKRYSWVEFGGASWKDGTPDSYNAVEYYEDGVSERPAHFIGIIEEDGAQPARGRIAIAVPRERLENWHEILVQIGAREIERSDSDSYPALWFTDPIGTRFELCSRRPSQSS